MEIITKNQEKVLQILKNFIQKHNYSPTLGELQNLLIERSINAKSKRSVVQYLESLEQKGYISRSSEERSIKLTNAQNTESCIDIPIIGTTNAGSPSVFAEENVRGFLKISKKLLRSIQNIFALEVEGDSMNKARIDGKYIEDGDYVVVDKSIQSPLNNDIVLAIVDGCATIKRFKQTTFGEIILLPDSMNPIHRPIYIDASDSFFINGKVINVLKAAKNL